MGGLSFITNWEVRGVVTLMYVLAGGEFLVTWGLGLLQMTVCKVCSVESTLFWGGMYSTILVALCV